MEWTGKEKQIWKMNFWSVFVSKFCQKIPKFPLVSLIMK